MNQYKRICIVSASILIIAAISISVWYFSRPILIGFILPIDMAVGNEANLFMRYYQDAHPNIGLRPVKFLIENPKTNEAEVRNAYHLLNSQGVSIIIGGISSNEGVWLADEASKTNIPTFGITASSAFLSGKKDAFFRLCPTNAGQAKAVGQYYQQKGLRRLALVTSLDNAAYVEPFVKSIQEDYIGEIVRIPFTSSEEVFQKILETKADGIFNILPAKDVIQVVKVVRSQKPGMIIGSSSWGSTEILSLYSGPLLNDVLFFSLGFKVSGQEYKAELARFENKYKMTATNGSQYSVSILNILYAAIQKVGSSREALKVYFETPRTYATSYGEMSIDAYGDVTTDRITILRTSNGTMNTQEVIELK